MGRAELPPACPREIAQAQTSKTASRFRIVIIRQVMQHEIAQRFRQLRVGLIRGGQARDEVITHSCKFRFTERSLSRKPVQLPIHFTHRVGSPIRADKGVNHPQAPQARMMHPGVRPVRPAVRFAQRQV